jgi:putative acetyltransferase
MDDTPPTIRAARPADAEAIAAMQALPGFRFGTLRLPYPNPDATRRWLESPPEGCVLLACRGEALVGMVDLHRAPGRRNHAAGLGMGVHDSWTGRGIGTSLMQEAITYAERWLGLRRLELTVFTDNAPALALYRRFGFTVEGTLRGYALRDGVLVDAYTMARLTEPAALAG